MHKANKTLEKGYKYTRPTFHYTHSFKRILKIRETKSFLRFVEKMQKTDLVKWNRFTGSVFIFMMVFFD